MAGRDPDVAEGTVALALSDRFAAMWLLAATPPRCSELASVDRELLDLDAHTLAIEDTRVVVVGYTVESDSKSNAGVRVISLDGYTVSLLRAYLAVLDDEREAFGADYDSSHSKLVRYPDGRALHADTITRRFNRLVDLAGVRRIRLHDVRHTYATLSQIGGIAFDASFDASRHRRMTRTCGFRTVASVG